MWRPVRVGCATRVRCVVDVARGCRAAFPRVRRAEAALRVRVEGFAETLFCGHLVVLERAQACAVCVGGLRGAVLGAVRRSSRRPGRSICSPCILGTFIRFA